MLERGNSDPDEAYMMFKDTRRRIVFQEDYSRSSCRVKNHADHIEYWNVYILS